MATGILDTGTAYKIIAWGEISRGREAKTDADS